VPRYDLPKAAPAPLSLVQQFVNTIDCEHRREGLGTPAELEGWLREHGLGIDEPISEADLRRAIDVREALRSLARANDGHPVPADAVSTLNHAIRAARIEFELDGPGRLAMSPGGRGLDGALGRLLASVIDATLDGTWVRLKSCRQCRWLFYDYSRNRSARWCSMELCGNRSKTRAYRERRRSGTTI
jgi:predicted RNA-binding Zn ribbon-like protein